MANIKEEEKLEEDELPPEKVGIEAASSSAAAVDLEREKRLEEKKRALSSSGSASSALSSRRDQAQRPGAFRSGGSTSTGGLASVDTDEGTDGEEPITSGPSPPPPVEEVAIHATLVEEAATPPRNTTTANQKKDCEEIVTAEVFTSNAEGSSSKRKWMCLGLICCALLLAATSAAVAGTVVVLEGDGSDGEDASSIDALESGSQKEPPPENGTPSSGDPDAGDNDSPPPEELLAPFDRITHHIAFFHSQRPDRCGLELEDDGGEPFVRIHCGPRERESALVFHEDYLRNAECHYHRKDEIHCMPLSEDGAFVVFTCETHKKDYESTSANNPPKRTSVITIEPTEVHCDPINDDVFEEDGPVRIAMTVGRICHTPRNTIFKKELRLPNGCVRGGQDYPQEFSLPFVGVACFRESDPCTADLVPSCAFGLDSFGVADSINDPECQVPSLEDQDFLFDDFLAKLAADVLDIL